MAIGGLTNENLLIDLVDKNNDPCQSIKVSVDAQLDSTTNEIGYLEKQFKSKSHTKEMIKYKRLKQAISGQKQNMFFYCDSLISLNPQTFQVLLIISLMLNLSE